MHACLMRPICLPCVSASSACSICLISPPDTIVGRSQGRARGRRRGGGRRRRAGAMEGRWQAVRACWWRVRLMPLRVCFVYLCIAHTHTLTQSLDALYIATQTHIYIDTHARTHTHTLSLSLTLSHTGNATLLRSRNDYVRTVRGLIVAAAPAAAGDDAPHARHCCARGGADALSQGWRNASLSAQLYCGEGLPSVAPVHLAVLLPGACPHACDRGVSHSVLCCVRGVSHCVTQVFSNTSACDRGVSQHCGRQPQSCLSPYCRQ